MRLFLLAFICSITCELSAQNSFLELNEQLYNSALSKNSKVLAVASKKKVYIVEVTSLKILKTIEIVKKNKSKNIISSLKFDNNDESLIIKIFNLDEKRNRYENQEYFLDFNYTYNLKEDLLSKPYLALEYITSSNTKNIKGFNKLSDTLVYYNPKNSILTFDEKYQVKINNLVITGEKYDNYYNLLQYAKDSKTSTITLNDSLSISSKGRIRHLKLSKNEDKFVVVYLDSLNAINNFYSLELRDSNSLNIITSQNYKTNNIIEDIKFIENDKYLAISEKKISQKYYEKQSKSSVYRENYITDNSITLFDVKTLKITHKNKASDSKNLTTNNINYWVIEEGNIVNYNYITNKVLNNIKDQDFDFYRIRGFHKVNQNEAIIIGSASNFYKNDFKTGILKYALKENKLFDEIAAYKSIDTIVNVNIPFVQNNNFFGDKIQFNKEQTTFLSQDNSGKSFQLWSTQTRKKLYEIDLKIISKSYLNQDGNSALILSKPENLTNGFLLQKLDLKKGIRVSKEFTVSNGKNPMNADFYFNHSGSKWIGVKSGFNNSIIWELDLDNMSFKILLEKDFNTGYVYNYKYLTSKENLIYFKGTAYSEVTKRKIEGVWSFDTNINQLKKIDTFTDSKDIFTFSKNKLISYTKDKYVIYDINSEATIQEQSINSNYIYNVIVHKNKSYVLLGDGGRHSKELSVLQYNNVTNVKLSEFKLKINYSFSSDFSDFFATENGLVYHNEKNLYLYSPDLKYTNKWQSSTGNKDVKYINVGNNGKLIVEGSHNIDLKTLETKKLEDGLDEREYGDFFITNGNEDEFIMITKSNGFSDNNYKPYIQCKLVKDKTSKEIIWESKKLKFDDYTYFNRFKYKRNKNFILFYDRSSRDKNYYVIDLQKKNLSERKPPIKDYYFSDVRTVFGKTQLYLFDWTKNPITYVYDLASGKLLSKIKDVQITEELPNGKLLYVNQEKNDNAFYLGVLKGKNLVEEFKYNALFNGDMHIYDDKRDCIIGVYKSLYFYKKHEKSPFKNLKINAPILSLSIQNDLLFVLIQGGIIKVIDLNTFKEKVTINIVKKNNTTKSVFFTPEGYFKASKENIRNYHFVKESKAFPLLNYELFLNRPDIILDELGYAKKEVINIYKEAFLKRLKRNNLSDNTDYLNLKRPQISLVNQSEIKPLTNIDSLSLKIKKRSNVATLLVYINGVPVLKNNNKEDININTTLKLNEGLNTITIIGKDGNGIESDPIILEVTNTKKAATSNIYYVGIGVSSYLDASMNLKFADKDVKSISKILTEKFKGRTLIDTLNNKNATKENILALKEKLKKSKINDIVIISFSGHGLVDDNQDFYFATHDIDFNNPNERGMSYNDIQFLLEDIPARKKILLLDACHSGEIDEEDNVTEVLDNDNVKSYLPEGAKGTITKSSRIGLNNSFELMQSLFYDLDRGNGSFVISAAGGKEYAFESKDWGNGVFTYSFIKAIQELSEKDDEKINISELKDYIYRSVTRLTKNKQKPTSRSENLEWDWVLK